MKDIPDLLRDADPLLHEPPRGAAERQAARRAVLASPPHARRAPSRRTAIVAVASFAAAGAAAGWSFWSRAMADVIAAVRFEGRLAETSPAPGLREATVAGTDRTIYLHDDVVVTNGDIAAAHAVPGNTPETFWVALTLTPGGSAKMAGASGGHIGRPMAILLDGHVVMAPTVRSVMSGEAVITGDFTKTEVDRIVAGIIGR